MEQKNMEKGDYFIIFCYHVASEFYDFLWEVPSTFDICSFTDILTLIQAVIFVDNSGADVILGILPFARELLRHGAQVCFGVPAPFMHRLWKCLCLVN